MKTLNQLFSSIFLNYKISLYFNRLFKLDNRLFCYEIYQEQFSLL